MLFQVQSRTVTHRVTYVNTQIRVYIGNLCSLFTLFAGLMKFVNVCTICKEVFIVATCLLWVSNKCYILLLNFYHLCQLAYKYRCLFKKYFLSF